jgi:hypothetical protein
MQHMRGAWQGSPRSPDRSFWIGFTGRRILVGSAGACLGRICRRCALESNWASSPFGALSLPPDHRRSASSGGRPKSPMRSAGSSRDGDSLQAIARPRERRCRTRNSGSGSTRRCAWARSGGTTKNTCGAIRATQESDDFKPRSIVCSAAPAPCARSCGPL